MQADLPVLQAGPVLACRQETVPVPELGGSVIVRGLTAAEQFAVEAFKAQATKRAREAMAAHQRRLQALPPDLEPPPAPDVPEMTFGEFRAYGEHMTEAVACAVTAANGLALYTADGWRNVAQHHPDVVPRLYGVLARLSGMDLEDARKN